MTARSHTDINSSVRNLAISIACRHAKLKPQSYYVEPFQPHEWVIDAIVNALQVPSTVHLSKGGKDPDAKVFSYRDVEALSAVAAAVANIKTTGLRDGVRALQQRCCGDSKQKCSGCRALLALLSNDLQGGAK